MHPILLLFILLMFPGNALAATSPVAQEMRALEIQRQTQERSYWSEYTRSIYFDKSQIDIPVDDKTKAEIEKVVNRYKKRFLDPKRANTLCQKVKALLLKDIAPVRSTSCIIEDHTFILQFKP